MRIAGNVAAGVDPVDGTERLFANAASHWWDGSEVYGTDDAHPIDRRLMVIAICIAT